MASSPLHNLIPRSSSMESNNNNNNNNNNGYITKERTNTSDSTNSNNGIGIFSPSYSKEDYDSDDNDSQQQQPGEEELLLNTTDTTNNEEEEEEDLMGSGMLILEALAPGESSSPIRNSSSNSQRKYDLCGSMYKRRGGFGRNKENNWYDTDVYIVFMSVFSFAFLQLSLYSCVERFLYSFQIKMFLTFHTSSSPYT
jgi:hypothetical protein